MMQHLTFIVSLFSFSSRIFIAIKNRFIFIVFKKKKKTRVTSI